MRIQLHEKTGIREIETNDYTIQQLKGMGFIQEAENREDKQLYQTLKIEFSNASTLSELKTVLGKIFSLLAKKIKVE